MRHAHSAPLMSRNERFKQLLWNEEKGTCCNKRPLDWFRLFSYMIVFNGTLFVGFVVAIHYMTEYFKENYPMAPFYDKSRFHEIPTPAITSIPQIDDIENAIVGYNTKLNGVNKNMVAFVKAIDKYFEDYREAEGNQNNYEHCTTKPASDEKACYFDMKKELGPCANHDYGYGAQLPCVYFKLNKFTNWQPEAYTSPADFDDDIPEEVKTLLKARSGNSVNNILFHCQTASGFETITHKFTYYPKEGFSFNFFPYKNEEHYLAPIVAIKFDYLEKGKLVVLKCNIYAKNIPESVRKTNYMEIMVYVN